jgi:hypothetical protein
MRHVPWCDDAFDNGSEVTLEAQQFIRALGNIKPHWPSVLIEVVLAYKMHIKYML